MEGFEGYVGIWLRDEQLVNDVVFSLLFVLFILFALVFHANYPLFMKMIRDVFYVKERLSLFEDIDGNETLFRSIMVFQGLALCSLFFFIIGRAYGQIRDYPDMGMNLLIIGVIFMILFIFYLFKQFLYKLTGFIFVSPEAYKTWRIGYTASLGSWGVLLYFPVVCLAFTEVATGAACVLFLLFYLLWRLIIIHKTISIFNTKVVGFLYIILYLCAQEISPLIFLYGGLNYLYNFY
ncbi:MAG: DUF4271 domain-containing protein [Tannerellaceae bacterium]|jgi:hypothetical protein|nr:DUF4271 domain-containing protein [Tannerellaceae bacterium]